MDLMVELGELALASRLRRLADALQRDVTDIYDELGLDFQARWFAVLAGLRGARPQSVTALAARLDVSRQAVSKTAVLLAARGLVTETHDPADARNRQVALSPAGRRLCRRLDQVWVEIRRANVDLLAETGVDLLRDLDRIETALTAESMAVRVRRRLGLASAEAVRIEDYRPVYKRHFRQLNEQWLEEHFVIEASDRRLLADPAGRIIRRGGCVLFAVVGAEVAGTCALIRHRDGTLELAKMAVAPAWRGRGFGRLLTLAIIERARRAGASQLWLRTSLELRPACRLYRSVGFRRARRHPFTTHSYCRRSIAMVLDLNSKQEDAT